jgi:tetratricopeptide (TPR) repeat protein
LDVIIVGSDGRDDINIGVTEKGARMINEDQNLFLKTVEEANGDIEKIFAITERKGELIDDYSLLRIEYKATTLEQVIIEVGESERALEFFNSGNYLASEKIVDKALQTGNVSQTILKLRAGIAHKNGSYSDAARYYAEYLDAYPDDTPALLLATQSYRLANDLETAADYSERLKLREPKNVVNLALLSEIYFDLKIFNRAKRTLENAMLLNPQNPRLLELENKLNKI